MRHNIRSKHSTYPERILYEFLKAQHITFKHRWLVAGKEIDFIVGKYAIEIDGHEQDPEKNNMLVSHGYLPIHIHNDELLKNRTLTFNKLLCLLQNLPSQEDS